MTSTITQGVRFALGLRRFLADRVEAGAAVVELRERHLARVPRLLGALDRLVWSVPSSPYRLLLTHAGLGRDDVRELVAQGGAEGALAVLHDEGVYVSYEEYLGLEPGTGAATRASSGHPLTSSTRWSRPTTWGAPAGRGGGTPVGKSFAHLRALVPVDLLTLELWDAPHTPNAVWFPVLPSSAGLNNVLRLGAAGRAPERWFSHVPPRSREVSDAKRLANRVVPALSRAFGVPLPRPEHVPVTDPDAVLDWCLDALGREGSAWLATYPTSAVALAQRSAARGVRLDGLLVRVGGEPLTAAKVDAISASGAMAVNGYAFAQAGRSAISCPHAAVEELHVLEHHMAVVTRRRARGDGQVVDALCWTSLDLTAPSVLLNTENDDYGRVWQDEQPCACLMGAMGYRTRLADIRGISKVLAGGITLAGERLERLAETELPPRFGGGPGDYQFSESEVDGVSRLVVRVAPRLGAIDERIVAAAVGESLRSDDLGLLAHEVWKGPGAVTVRREAPVASRSGKVLVFEPLR